MKGLTYNTQCMVRCLTGLMLVSCTVYFFHTHEIVVMSRNRETSQETFVLHDRPERIDELGPSATSLSKQSLRIANSSALQVNPSIPEPPKKQILPDVTIATYESDDQGQLDKIMMNRFSSRQKAAQNFCAQPWSKEIKVVKPVHKSKSMFGAGRLKWCQIPKVGTTYLKYLNKNLIVKDDGHHKVPLYKKKYFYLVREPYSRMMSGYIGKIVTNQPWWNWYGRYIVQQFRLNATQKEKNCGSNVSFPEFVKYFIHSHKTGIRKNRHFVPMYELCNPCQESFDFIGHLETLKDDISYMLGRVNISTNADFSDEARTLKGKAKTIVKQRPAILKCESMCAVLRRVWWSFQARGLILKDIPFPVNDNDCDSIKPKDFVELSWDAHEKSVDRFDKSKQKRDSLVELFLQVPLGDRIKVRDILAPDFRMYGYEAQPDDLFPELAKEKSSMG